MRTGTPVSVLAISPGQGPAPSLGPLPPVRYLMGAGARRESTVAPSPAGARTDRGGGAGARPRGRASLLPILASDLASLRGHPRRSARALRLAVLAVRAARSIPEGTARLHAHFANDAAALARYLGALCGLPYRVTAHAYDLYQDPFLLAPNLEAAERVYTISRANLELLKSWGDLEGPGSAKLSLLRCGIDLEEFPFVERGLPAPGGSSPLGPARESRAGAARLICVARLVPKKGHAVLLDAVSRLVSEGFPIELDLVGAGPLAEDLHARAERGDLAGRVRFHGALPGERVRELIRESDLMVLASRIAEDGDRDGIPVSLIEAMALGVPVVATSVSGIPELVTPETGGLVPPDRPDLLAGAIRASLSEPAERTVARTRLARARVEAEYDLRRQIATLLDERA